MAILYCHSNQHRVTSVETAARHTSPCKTVLLLCFGRFSLYISTIDDRAIRLPADINEFLKNMENSRYLPCNIKRAREFYSKYGDDGTNEAGTFRKRGKEVLQIAKIILDNLRVRFWLSSGTCLGS